MHSDPPLGPDLSRTAGALRDLLGPCGDIVFRPLKTGGTPPLQAELIYCRSMVDAEAVDQHALSALLLQLSQSLPGPAGAPAFADLAWLAERRDLPLGAPAPVMTMDQCVQAILGGALALLVDGCGGALLFRVHHPAGRAVGEPSAEGVIRGPQEGFVENLESNVALVRRRLQSLKFRIERRRIGSVTGTEVVLLYLDGIVKPGVLSQVRRRLRRIKIDGILDAGYIEELIEDAPLSPFPTVAHTERPDKVAAGLLEGQVAILAAGSPQALLMPTSLVQLIHSPEDYYERYIPGSGIRLLRFFAAFLALTLPSLYVAITTYHHEMIPSALFQALAAQREGVPWPAVLEAYLMEIAFELLREAGLRLPKPVGQAVSIIGGLVVGEAAIRARIASAGTIIVVATTGIASYVVPAYNLSLSLRMIRFPLMALAATLGLHGVVIGLLLLLIHLLNLSSFGQAYLSPATPAKPGQWRDALVRAPWWKLNRRRAPGGGA